MTRDDIIRMALEADLLDERDALADPINVELIVYLEHFANLVAAAERDGCVVAGFYACVNPNEAVRVRDAIRARSQS